MANANPVVASKFFAAPVRDIILFSEEDFESLTEFKTAIADQVATLQAQNLELRFQHKGFLRGQTWSIDINKMSMYCDTQQCRLAQWGNAGNNYTWRIVPRVKIADSATPF
jgi:hypothetical protein